MAAGRLTLGVQLEPPNLDPTSSAAAAIKEVTFPNVYEGLVELGPGGAVQPLLATGWTISPDGLTYRFRLRQGVRFHDGTLFDASSVRFSLDRARAKASTNSQKPRFAVIDRVDIIDPYTVDIRLKRRYGSFLQVLGWGDAVMLSPASAASDAVRPVGTGPFRFADWRRGDSITLTRNPDYWGRPASLSAVTFRVIPDPSAALSALKAGDVDAFAGFPAPEALGELRKDPRFVDRIGPSEAETLVALNNRIPPLNNLLVRRALSYAIDRKAIIAGAMFGYGQPIGSHYPPQDPGYVDLTGLYPHDPAKARALLAKAGYPSGFSLTLKLPPPAYARRAGEIVAAELAEVGIKVRIQNIEWAQWLAQVFGRRDFDMTIVAHVEPMDYDIYARDDYYFGYQNPRYKQLLTELDDSLDPARRAALLGQMQRTLAGDAVNLFLFEYPTLGVWNAKVKGLWAPTPVRTFDLAAASIEGAPAAAAGQREARPAPTWLWLVLASPFALAFAWGVLRTEPAYLARRLATLAATLVVTSLVVFALLQIAPGDPARYMMGLSADPEALAALRQQLGLDAPAAQRYLAWIAGLAHGDFGISYTYRVPVGGLIAERLAVSLPLTLYALLLSTLGAFTAALAAAAKPGGIADRLFGALTPLGVAVPNFWIGMLLVVVFASGLKWFDAGGFPGWDSGVLPALKALTLPAVALALPQGAILARVLRAELKGQLVQDYVRTARAKGLTARQVLLRHALPNALIPALTILGLQVSFLLAGAVIIENVFFLPGLGRLVFQAIAQRDLMVVQSVVLLLVFAVVSINFLVDLAYAAADPRLRRRG
ncbi:ABC transporter substrate-binding protein [Phenylobacterium montanum]|uniref:ABC transporter substrate-binding protein n=1 Tax=Phenylobacterium montanum TaxID=2823693 RepID=UPI0020124EF0|nr:ABC transporter substrate-binding protein [Caulobacter sp. S6]